MHSYAMASLAVVIPSIMLMVLMCAACPPVFCIFGCCENCWYKKRKIHKKLVPEVVWGVWLFLFLLVLLLTAATTLSFERFTKGMAGSVCDVDGSLGELSAWFHDLAGTVLALGDNIAQELDDGRDNIMQSLDRLSANVDVVGDTLQRVLTSVNVSAQTITEVRLTLNP